MKKSKGFTLIELLVVIAIIGILAVAITIAYSNVRNRAKDAKRKEIARKIAQAEEIYYQTDINGEYTGDLGSLDIADPDEGSAPGPIADSDNSKWSDKTRACNNESDTVDQSPGEFFGVQVKLSNGNWWGCDRDGCGEVNNLPCFGNP